MLFIHAPTSEESPYSTCHSAKVTSSGPSSSFPSSASIPGKQRSEGRGSAAHPHLRGVSLLDAPICQGPALLCLAFLTLAMLSIHAPTSEQFPYSTRHSVKISAAYFTVLALAPHTLVMLSLHIPTSEEVPYSMRNCVKVSVACPSTSCPSSCYPSDAFPPRSYMGTSLIRTPPPPGPL